MINKSALGRAMRKAGIRHTSNVVLPGHPTFIVLGKWKKRFAVFLNDLHVDLDGAKRKIRRMGFGTIEIRTIDDYSRTAERIRRRITR